MKALVEGIRALYVESAIGLDVKARHPDAATSAEAEGMLALLTPVLKSFISDCALKVTEIGIQIFGGHGYVHEHGMEQLYRDARIVPLYEGTNGIQALDLVHRKLSLDEGRVVERYFDKVASAIEALRASGLPHDMTRELEHALQLLREATSMMRGHVAQDATEAAAGASDYLRLLGFVALGAAWARMASAAHAGLARSPERADFLNGKIKTARFYFERLLPEARLCHASIVAGADALMAISEQEL
jgi:hypothetical protein